MAMAMSSPGSYDAFLSQQQNQWMQPPQQQNSWTQPQQQNPWMQSQQSQQQTPWIQPQQEHVDVDALTIRDPPSLTHRVASKVVATYNHTLDSLAPYTGKRWFMAAWMLFCYAWRIYAVGGFYLVSYGFFIHFIFLFIDFLAPKNDPEIEAEDADDESGALPVTHHDDYRPFIRRLPEYSFWLGTCKASMVAFLMTFLSFLDIPVFWPILAVYAVFLAYLLLKERVMHMIKYKYVPFSLSKPTYGAGGKVRKTIGIYSK